MEPKPLPFHGACFTCGPENDHGMQLTYFHEGERVVVRAAFSAHQQGPRGHAHGGAISSVLDEAMGKAAGVNGFMSLAANLTVNFRKPLPLGTPVVATAWVREAGERKVNLQAEMRGDPSGELYAEATSIFVVPRNFWERMGKPASGVG